MQLLKKGKVMKNKILMLLRKYSELIRYSFWGIFATVTNIATYYICYDMIHISNTMSNIIAWAVSVLVAFVTNKIWVFNSRNVGFKRSVNEFVSFAGFRFVSELFDLGIMYFAVDMMNWPALFWKILANGIVIILNYFFSKFIIFRKK